MSKLNLYGHKSRSVQTFKNKTGLSNDEVVKYVDEGKTANRYFINLDTDQVIEVDIKSTNPKDVLKNGVPVLKSWGIKQLPIKKVINSNDEDILLKKKVLISHGYNVIPSIFVHVKMSFYISDELIEREINFTLQNVDLKDIQRRIIVIIENYLMGFGALDSYKRHVIIDNLLNDNGNNHIYLHLPEKKQKVTLKNYILKEQEYYNICNLWGNIVQLPEIKNDENCVSVSIKNKYPKISQKSIDKYFKGGNKGETAENIYNFCKDYNIKLIMYNIHGNVIYSYYPKKKSDKKACIFMAYNNHIYTFKNSTLEKITIPKENIDICDSLDENFDELLKNKIIPSNINIFSNVRNKTSTDKKRMISSFEHNNTLYVANQDYYVCKDVLNKFGIADKIYPSMKITNMIDTLLHLYTSSTVKSFFPFRMVKYIPHYINEKALKSINKNTKLLSIDKRKAYANALLDLEYLIYVDYRQANVIKHKINPKTINPTNAYLARPDIPNHLLPNKEYYSGYHLIYASNCGFGFTILEEIETKKADNYYKPLIRDLFNKIDEKIVKDMLVKHIGKMEKDTELAKSLSIDSIGTQNELNAEWNEGNIFKYTNDKDVEMFFTLKEKEKVSNVYNNKFVKMQILDRARVVMYEKMKEIGLKQDQLISIDTDCITFIDDGSFEDLKNTLGKDKFTGWKQEYKTFYDFECTKDYDTVYENEIIPIHNGNGELWNCYAGCGKSYYIKNTLIPELIDDYLVVTPSHNASKDYYKNDFKCKVIQTFNYTDILPEETNIIVDEFGLCDKRAHDFLYRCMIAGKKIYAFGDFKQLLPVGEDEHFNKQHYLNIMFDKIHEMDTNYRNGFTKKYYDKLINKEIDLVKEIKKHRVDDYNEADIIICRTNKECDEYNKLIANKLKISYKINKNGEITSFEPKEGIKIICHTNDLRKYEIYNNFDFIIKEFDGNDLIFDDGTILNKKYLKHFSLGYAITSYKAQGQEFKSFYIPSSSLKNINGRFAYTMISRLKTK